MADNPLAKRGVLLLAIALMGLFAAFGLRMVFFIAPPVIPELLADLPESKSEADQQILLARLSGRYHMGVDDAAKLAADLRAEGFAVDDGQRVATFERRPDIADKCRRSGNVRWTAGDGGKLATLTGGFTLHCPEH
jgi:hypothetical protein